MRIYGWTYSDDARLRQLRAEGLNCVVISGRLGRSPTSVRERCRLLGLALAPRGAPQKPAPLRP